MIVPQTGRILAASFALIALAFPAGAWAKPGDLSTLQQAIGEKVPDQLVRVDLVLRTAQRLDVEAL